MAMPSLISTVKMPDPSTAAFVSQANAPGGERSGTREFAEVLNDTAAKSRSGKEISDERPARSRSGSDAPSQTRARDQGAQDSEIAQTPTAEGPAVQRDGEVPVSGPATTDAATGNALPPWTVAAVAPAPDAATDATANGEPPVAASGQYTPFATMSAMLVDEGSTARINAGAVAPEPLGNGASPSSTTVTTSLRGPQPFPALEAATAASGSVKFDAELATLLVSSNPGGVNGDRGMLVTPQLESATTVMQAVTAAPTQPATSASIPYPVAQAAIPLPLNHPQWQNAFAARVIWQVREGLQQASLAINPPDLGPVDVHMSISDGEVSAQFVTPHQAVRQVIEEAMPRLRDMLSQSGLNLANANVFQQAPDRDGQAQTFGNGTGPAAPADVELVDDGDAMGTERIVHRGLIDAYV